MTRWAIIGGGAVALIATIYFYGLMQYRSGQRDLVIEIEQARAESIEEREEIADAVEDLTDDELLERALGYVRSP